MLLFLLKHGKVASLTLRSTRNGSSSAAARTGVKSTIILENDRRPGWKGTRKAPATTTTPVRMTTKRPDDISVENAGAKGNNRLARDAQRKIGEGEEAGKNNDAGDATRIFPLSNGLPSKLPASTETGTTSSTSTTMRRRVGTNFSAYPHQGAKVDSSFPDKLQRDEVVTTSPASSANSSFLDTLHQEHWSKRISHNALDEHVSASTKLSRLRNIMLSDNPQALLGYMIRESEDKDFMRAIPGVTFVELLRQLDPGDDFLPLRPEYRRHDPKHYWTLSEWRSQFYKALQDRRQFYLDIATRRVESGSELQLGEYTQLLDLAHATWNGPLALLIMKRMIVNHVQPSLTCYNHYFEARCWSGTGHPDDFRQLGAIPHNLEIPIVSPSSVVQDDVKVDGHRVEEYGIRWEITRMFKKMVNEGINADTRSYCNLLTAQSREGDLHAIKSVLHTVWKVDIDELLAGTSEIDKWKLGEDSPIYPTEDLLWTLAHVFGSNSNVSAALRLVDCFSSKYNISISQRVWSELLRWTFISSDPRGRKRRVDGAATGQLPLESVEKLWNVMRGPPYFGEPNLLMYDYLIRSFWRRKRELYAHITYMREGVESHERALKAHLRSQAKISLHQTSGDIDPETFDSQKIQMTKAWSDWCFYFELAKKWFEWFYTNQRLLTSAQLRDVKRARKRLPDAVKGFSRYRTNPIVYHVETGQLEFESVGRGLQGLDKDEKGPERVDPAEFGSGMGKKNLGPGTAMKKGRQRHRQRKTYITTRRK